MIPRIRGKLGGGFKYFLFSPRKLVKGSNLTSIFFQMDWFNHHLGKMFEQKEHVRFSKSSFEPISRLRRKKSVIFEVAQIARFFFRLSPSKGTLLKNQSLNTQ